ncbi:MAG: PIN domain-containing protein [Desulfobacterales bacterium]|nr:PIN domain-containing protein [Desulfobacterales bacterium]
MKDYLDSDLLIWHLRGERKALNLLKRLRDKKQLELWTGAMQRAEVVFFMRPEEESSTFLLLAQLKTAPIDQEIIDRAGEFYRKWNPHSGTDVNDAILAATVRQTGGTIYTLNTKHYPMPARLTFNVHGRDVASGPVQTVVDSPQADLFLCGA